MLRRSVLVIAVVLMSFACGGSPTAPSDSPSGESGSTASSGPSGTLNLRITDSPFGRAKAVLITFSEVAVLRGDTWTRVPFPDNSPTWMCDLKKLENGANDILGSGAIPLADYTSVRVTIQSARVFGDFSSSSATPCARSIPAPAGAAPTTILASREGRTSGAFQVRAGATTIVLIDFDGESSLTQEATGGDGSGAYFLSPVIRFLGAS